MDDSSSQRDGHDHLLRLNSDDSMRYTGAPNRQALTNSARQRRTNDRDLDEEVLDTRTEGSTEDIILLEPKSKTAQSRHRHHTQQQPRQTNTNTTSSHRSGEFRAPVKRTTDQHILRQPSQSRDADRYTSQQIPAIRQTTQPRRADRYDDVHDSYDERDEYDTYRPRNTRDTHHEQRREFHWLVPTGVTLIIAILCYLLVYGAWVGGKNVYNNLTYGSVTRTSNLEAVVGDHDSATSPTHFVALNLHGTVDIVEFPGGDVTHAKVYPGPHLLWSNADKAVVTMEVKDVNGDKKPDLIIHVYGDTDLLFHQTSASFVLLNNGSGFAPMTAYQ